VATGDGKLMVKKQYAFPQKSNYSSGRNKERNPVNDSNLVISLHRILLQASALIHRLIQVHTENGAIK